MSKELADEYLKEYDRETDVMPNAVVAPRRVSAGDTLASLGLEPRRYALSVGRLVPEKGVHVLAEAYAEAKTDIPLVIVGEPSGTEEYVAGIRARHEGDRVRFVGAHYAEAFEELMSSARLFVTASELEGLPTSLIEAGLYELPIVATDIGPHAEVLAGGPSESWTSPVGDVSGLTPPSKLRWLAASCTPRRGWPFVTGCSPDTRRRRRPRRTSRCTPAVLARRRGQEPVLPSA